MTRKIPLKVICESYNISVSPNEGKVVYILSLDCIRSYSLQDWRQLIDFFVGYLKKYFHQAKKTGCYQLKAAKNQLALKDKELILKGNCCPFLVSVVSLN